MNTNKIFNFVATNSEMVELSKLISTVADKDSSIAITFGAGKAADDKLVAVVKVLSGRSTLMYRVHTNVPDNYEGEQVAIAAKASAFNGILDAVLPFKSDVTIGIGEGKMVIGVYGKARFDCPILSEMPQEVKPSAPIAQFALDDKSQRRLIRSGLSCSSASADENGFQNACLRINTKTADITGFSTDGFLSEITFVKGSLPDIGKDEKKKAMKEAMDKALSEYCEKTGQKEDALVINIPHDEVTRIKALSQGAAKTGYVIDANHVSIMVNNAIAYTFSQGAKSPMDVELVSKKLDTFDGQSLQLDNDALAKAVEVHNKVVGVVGTPGKDPVLFSANDDKLIIRSGEGGVNASTVDVAKMTGECDGALNGAIFTKALSLADKGNLVVRVIPGVVVLNAGTLDKVDKSSMVCVMQVNVAARKAEEEAEEAAESDEVTEE